MPTWADIKYPLGTRSYQHIDDDPRLLNTAVSLPRYLMGEMLIADGPDRSWEYVVNVVRQMDYTAFLKNVAELANQMIGWRAARHTLQMDYETREKPVNLVNVEWGDSPGSDDYIIIKTSPTTGVYIGLNWDMPELGGNYAALEYQLEEPWEPVEGSAPVHWSPANLDDPYEMATWCMHLWEWHTGARVNN